MLEVLGKMKVVKSVPEKKYILKNSTFLFDVKYKLICWHFVSIDKKCNVIFLKSDFTVSTKQQSLVAFGYALGKFDIAKFKKIIWIVKDSFSFL